MFSLQITPDFLTYILAGLVAILCDWFPGLAAWFGQLTSARKQQIMAVILAVIVVIVFGLGCAGVLANMTCDKAQASALVQVYMLAIGINQGIHLLSKPGPGKG